MNDSERGFQSNNDVRVDVNDERLGVALDHFDALFERVERHFYRSEVKKRARQYLTGLIAPIEHKSARAIAAYSGEPACDSMERFLTTAKWSVDGLMADLRAFVVEIIGDARGILVIKEQAFFKKGIKSVGVLPSNSAMGYQVALFLGYVTERGCAFLDRRLYITETWMNSRQKRRSAYIPEPVEADSLDILAQKMLSNIEQVPHAWVIATDPFLHLPNLYDYLQRRRQPCILCIKYFDGLQKENEYSYAQLEELQDDDHDLHWSAWPLYQPYAGYMQWLLKCQSESDQFIYRPYVMRDYDGDGLEEAVIFGGANYYLALAPEGMHLPGLVKVINASRQVDQAMRIARNVAGLDHYEARSWPAWHRHTALALLAYAHLLRSRVNVE